MLMETEVEVRSPREMETCLVTVEGEVHFSEAQELEHRLLAAVRAGRSDLLVDISGVSFISCEGLAALLRTRREAEGAGGQLWLVPPSEPVLGVFRVTGLTGLFTLQG